MFCHIFSSSNLPGWVTFYICGCVFAVAVVVAFTMGAVQCRFWLAIIWLLSVADNLIFSSSMLPYVFFNLT